MLKDFQNSTKCKDMLEACERRILEEGGSLGGVQHSLRHLDFVEPRFESFAAPRRRYVCLLRAVALVLAMKAGDMREKPEDRNRCEAALQAMTGKDCFVAGLAGDYGEMCAQFLRLFDVHDHDPARTSTQLRDFEQAMRSLFVQGYVLCKADETDIPGLGRRKTLAEIALENIMEPLVLQCSLPRSAFFPLP